MLFQIPIEHERSVILQYDETRITLTQASIEAITLLTR
jgi:hypothetical protein